MFHKCPVCSRDCMDEMLAACCCMEKSYYCGTCGATCQTYDEAVECCTLHPTISYHCPICYTEYKAKIDAAGCHAGSYHVS